MPQKSINAKVSLSSDEVIIRATHYFAGGLINVKNQTENTVTFDGRISTNWGLSIFHVLTLGLFHLPGWKRRRMVTIVVTTAPIENGSEVAIVHPNSMKKRINDFLGQLPAIPKAAG